MARMRRACLASAVRAASARNCEILKSWCVISIADMLPALRINDMLHRVTVAVVWESPQESGSQAAGMMPLFRGSDHRDKCLVDEFAVGLCHISEFYLLLLSSRKEPGYAIPMP